MNKLLGLITLAAGLALSQEPSRTTSPKVLRKTQPEYTAEAKAAKIEGPVILSVTIGADGVARDIAVTKSLDPGLDNKAVAAVQTWMFQPATKDGEAVTAKATIEVNFRLM